jgi:hypothetical protein
LITLDQFVRQVRKMRDAQKHYFKTRDTRAFNEATYLERLIDLDIKRYESDKQGQQSLDFGDPPSRGPYRRDT